MTANKDFKRVIREHARKGGMSYTAARRRLLTQRRPSWNHREASMKGWRITGSHAHEYELGVTDERVGGHRVAFLRFKGEGEPGGFGAQVQVFAPDEYLGKKVRFSGLLKAEEVTGWAGLWMRVDSPETARSGVHLSFDNMEDRSLTGTTDWTRCDIVLEVPPESSKILVGTVLKGNGTVYMAGFALEAVPDDVPTTGHARMPKRPVNLSFDEE